MSKQRRVNLNADLGESFGRYLLGNDEALMPYINTAHAACGYHAADPATMLRTAQLAKRFGVELGAHIAYPDLLGFGRRRMSLTEDEVFEISIYQIGAMLGFCQAVGIPLTHVKPHGELYLTGVRDQATARGIVRAVRAVDERLALIMYGPIAAAECEQHGVPMIHEGYIDLDFGPDGAIVLERRKAARNPDEIADKAVRLLEEGGLAATDGSWLPFPVQSICLHGDGPNAIELVQTVRTRLMEAGYELVGLAEFLPSTCR